MNGDQDHECQTLLESQTNAGQDAVRTRNSFIRTETYPRQILGQINIILPVHGLPLPDATVRWVPDAIGPNQPTGEENYSVQCNASDYRTS